MDKKSEEKVVFDDHLGCFGDFDVRDPVCKKFCALSLRCAIETNQEEQFEFLEDIIYPDDMFVKIH